LSQCAVTATDLDDVENARFSEQPPHLFQLACDERTESRVAHRRGPEVGADAVTTRRVEASPPRVQADLHELGERNPPVRFDERPDLLLNR
jgi:hypothetical protein